MAETQCEEAYRRALTAEPHLAALERLVDGLCALVRPSDVLCAGCVWEQILKPLVDPWVGYGRGLPAKAFTDPDPEPESGPFGGIFGSLPTHSPAPPKNPTERWLRSCEAFDAVTNTWLARLKAADPGNGHGIARAERRARATIR